MKKKLYVKPTAKVIVLNQRPQLLVGSGTSGSRAPYGDPITDTWG